MKFLKCDSEVRILKKREELKEYLNFRKEHDEWQHPYICECAVVGIENHPLFIPDELEKNHIAKDDSAMECIGETGLFLSFPYHGKRAILPTRDTSLSGIYQRAGLMGPTITNYVEPSKESKKKVLPVIEKAAWLSRGMSLYGNKCTVLIRDEKVSACHSGEYTILPADELVDILETEIYSVEPNAKYEGGRVDHTYLNVRWLLNNPVMDASFKLTMEDLGFSPKEVQCGIGFATSDVGSSRAYAYPFLMMDGKEFRFSKGRGAKHERKDAMDLFRKAMSGICDLFSETEEKIEELGNTDIQDVHHVVERITTEFRMFPQQQSKTVLAAITPGTKGTAIDCYLALTEIIQSYSSNKSPETQLNLMEKMVSFLSFDYQSFDV